MPTETAILTNSHNMKLTALTPGDMLDSRLVMPRAIKAPGKTTTAAPYNSDAAIDALPVMTPAAADATTPTPACAPMTRQGETDP